MTKSICQALCGLGRLTMTVFRGILIVGLQGEKLDLGPVFLEDSAQ